MKLLALVLLLAGCGAGLEPELEELGQSQLGVRHFEGCGETDGGQADAGLGVLP